MLKKKENVTLLYSLNLNEPYSIARLTCLIRCRYIVNVQFYILFNLFHTESIPDIIMCIESEPLAIQSPPREHTVLHTVL